MTRLATSSFKILSTNFQCISLHILNLTILPSTTFFLPNCPTPIPNPVAFVVFFRGTRCIPGLMTDDSNIEMNGYRLFRWINGPRVAEVWRFWRWLPTCFLAEGHHWRMMTCVMCHVTIVVEGLSFSMFFLIFSWVVLVFPRKKLFKTHLFSNGYIDVVIFWTKCRDVTVAEVSTNSFQESYQVVLLYH